MLHTHAIALILLSSISPSVAAPPLAKPIVRHPDRNGIADENGLAKQLLDRARKQLMRNNFHAACPLVEESVRLDPDVRSKLLLAKCYDLTERHARAWEVLDDIAKTAKDPADVKKARGIADAIASRLGMLKISAPRAGMHPRGMKLHVDGAPLQDASWSETGDANLFLDIGEHVIVATAPGKIPWRQPFLISSADQRMTIEIPALSDEAPAPSSSTERTEKASAAVVPLAFLGGASFFVGVGASVAGMVDEGSRADLFVPVGACLTLGGVAMLGAALLARHERRPKTAGTPQLRIVPMVAKSSVFVSLEGAL